MSTQTRRGSLQPPVRPPQLLVPRRPQQGCRIPHNLLPPQRFPRGTALRVLLTMLVPVLRMYASSAVFLADRMENPGAATFTCGQGTNGCILEIANSWQHGLAKRPQSTTSKQASKQASKLGYAPLCRDELLSVNILCYFRPCRTFVAP